MPQSDPSSGSRDFYEVVAAVPMIDDETAENDTCQLIKAPNHPSSACPLDNGCINDNPIVCGKHKAPFQGNVAAKALRPRTTAQRDAKMDKTMDKKRKHADVLQPEPWHPARTVLMRLSSKPAVTAHDAPLSESLRPSLQGPLKEVSSCINKMLRQGQSTSLAVIGPQGVGKSLVCWRAAAQAIKESGLPEASVVTVHLCGNLHKDELRALKYIARELCQFCGYNFTNSASVDDNIKFLEHVLQKISREDRHVIFLLEDLECFLQECKSRVLYTLLDLLQKSNVRAVVIGISCMISVLDLMEKRVRSRFSHKVIVVHAPCNNSSSQSEDSPEGLLAAILHIHNSSEHGPQDAELEVQSWNETVNAALADAQMKSILGCLSMSGIACSRLEDICRTFCCKLLMEVTLQSQSHVDLSSVKRCLHEAVQRIVSAEDPIQDILSDCSTLQINIIQAALRLKQAARKMSFQSILSEYKHPQTHRCESGLKYTEQAIWAAFQSLKQKDVLFSLGQQNSSRVSLAKQQVDISISSADMRRLI